VFTTAIIGCSNSSSIRPAPFAQARCNERSMLVNCLALRCFSSGMTSPFAAKVALLNSGERPAERRTTLRGGALEERIEDGQSP